MAASAHGNRCNNSSRHVRACQGVSGHIRTQCCRCREEREARCEFVSQKRCITCSRLTRGFPQIDPPDQIFKLIGRVSASFRPPPARVTHTLACSSHLGQIPPRQMRTLEYGDTARVIVPLSPDLVPSLRARSPIISWTATAPVTRHRPHRRLSCNSQGQQTRPRVTQQGSRIRRLQVTDFRGQ
jgi:hypothetical protein